MSYLNLKKVTAAASSVAISATSVLAFGVANVTAATTFTDASQISSWAVDSVNKLVEAGVLKGNPDGSFNPKGGLNRAEMAQVAMKAAGLSEDTAGAPHFNDVKPTDWFYAAVETLYNNGVVGGVNGGALDANGMATYNPAGAVNRAEAAKILTAAFGLEFAYVDGAPSFPDVAKSAWFYDFVETAYAHGILGGYQNGNFGPSDAVTREQISVIAQNSRVTSADGSLKRDGYTAGKASAVVVDGGEGEEEPTDPVESSDGTLAIALSASTPAAGTVPTGGVAPIASFDLTASSAGDVTVSTLMLTRGGLGDDGEIDDLVFRDSDGVRISRAQGFNSDDEATISMLSGGFVVEAGTTETITAFAAFDTDANTNGRHNVAISAADMVESNAKSVTGTFPVMGKTFEVSSTKAGKLVVEDQTVPNVKVGNTAVKIADFDLESTNQTSGQTEDVTLKSITFEQQEGADLVRAVENVKLMFEGAEVAAGTINGDFLSFVLDTPIVIKEGNTRSVEVVADVIGEPGEVISLALDNSADVYATGSRYGFGVNVDITGAAGEDVTIDAGEVTIVKRNPADEFLKDKDNVVFGEFDIITKPGAALRLEDFKATMDATIADETTEDVDDYFSNFELYSPTTGRTYTLDVGTNTDVADDDQIIHAVTDTSMGITLAAGSTTTFQIRADVEDIDVSAVSVSFSIDTDAAGFKIEETTDDEQVEDITPSLISFNAIDGVSSSMTIAAITQSNATAVVGTNAVNAMEFEIKAGSASKVVIDELRVRGYFDAAGGSVNNSDSAITRTYITQLSLYEVGNATALDTVSQIAATTGESTFDGFEVEIAANQTKRFRVEVGVADDQTIDNDTFRFYLQSISAEDEDGDDITAGGLPLISNRTLTIAGTGTLTVTVDNTDTATDSAKWVLGGNENMVAGKNIGTVVASFEMTALNEPVQINDVTLANDGTTGLQTAISELVLLKNDKTTEIARKSVTGNDTAFDDVNYVVAEGTENVYVGVVAHKMGRFLPGSIKDGFTMQMESFDAEGDASGEDVTVAASSDSLAFGTVPTRISSVSFVSSNGGVSVANSLTAGTNNIAIIQLTTDASANTDATDGSSLVTKLTVLDFTIRTNATVAINSVEVERIGGTGDKTFATTHAAVVASTSTTNTAISTTLGSADAVNSEINNGSSAYFLVKMAPAFVTGTTTSYSAQVLFTALDGGDIEYRSDDNEANGLEDSDLTTGGLQAVGDRDELRLDYTTLDGPILTVNL